ERRHLRQPDRGQRPEDDAARPRWNRRAREPGRDDREQRDRAERRARSRPLALEDDDLVADRDRAAGEDVGVDARAVGELLDDPGPSHRLEMGAGLAELHAVALDFPYAEALPDEHVQVDAANGQLPAG